MGRVVRGFGKFLLFIVVPAIAVGVIAAALLSGWWQQTPVSEGCTAAVQNRQAELTFDEAQNAALIADISVRRELPARAATIALATAFQESGMLNRDDGHLDSIGLFQQRPSMGWGSADQIRDPHYSTNKFYEKLADVDGYEQMDIAEAAQKVQVSADGEAYAQHEDPARALASALTGQSPAAFSCQLREAPTDSSAPEAVGAELTKTMGERTIDMGAGELRIEPNDSADAWVLAHWALANAKRFGITEVSYADRVWDAEDSQDGWQTSEDGTQSGVVAINLAS